MGLAPTPEAVELTDKLEQREQRKKLRQANLRIQLTYMGDIKSLAKHHEVDYVLGRSQIGPADDRMARNQTGMTATAAFSAGLVAAQTGQMLAIGSDMALVLWWLARRRAGERNLSYAEVERHFPSVDDVEDIEAKWLWDAPDEPATDEASGGDDPES